MDRLGTRPVATSKATSPTARPTYGVPIVKNKVHVHDFHATILHLLGLGHERLTYRMLAATTA